MVITRSYTLHGKDIDSTKCIIHEVRPAPRDKDREEDEVEMFYPTTRRAFIVPNSVADNTVLNIRQTSFGCGRLGATVWPSAIALASLLANDDTTNKLVAGKRVMELGSGCGLPSLLAKDICGAQSICSTDYWELPTADADGNLVPMGSPSGDRLVPKDLFGVNLAYNIGSSFQSNGSTSTDDNSDSGSSTSSTSMVQRLDWHDEMGIFKLANSFCPDMIIGSDLVYYPMDTIPLLQTLEILLKSNGGDKDALLILPLPPQAEREALPEFRKRLEEDGELGDDYEVQMDELEMTGKGRNEDDEEEIYRFLRVHIHSACE